VLGPNLQIAQPTEIDAIIPLVSMNTIIVPIMA
jgi:hypothetical protein